MNASLLPLWFYSLKYYFTDFYYMKIYDLRNVPDC